MDNYNNYMNELINACTIGVWLDRDMMSVTANHLTSTVSAVDTNEALLAGTSVTTHSVGTGGIGRAVR